MSVSIDALAGIAAIEDEREAAEPGPVNIVAPSNPITRGLKWGINYINPNKEAKGGLIPRVMGTYEKNEAKRAAEDEAFEAILRAQDREEAIDAFRWAWSDERFQNWVDKHSYALMVDDFITDVSSPVQSDLIGSAAYTASGSGGVNQKIDKISFYLDDDQFGPEGGE